MKTKYIFRSLLVSLLLFIGYPIMAQSLHRQTICSSGSSDVVDKVAISQTIGQPYNTVANYNNGISYRPGFQQPADKNGRKAADTKLTLLLFPNPVADALTIQSPISIPNATIRVVDMKGMVVYLNSVKNLIAYKVDCQQWANGAYAISVSDGVSKVFSSNIVVNHL